MTWNAAWWRSDGCEVINLLTRLYQVLPVILVSYICRELLPLSELLWDHEVPLIVAKSYGFLGYFRIQLKEHVVIESHPDSQHLDLRLDKPFPALLQYVHSFDLDTMDLKDHAHVPYIVPLMKALNDWQKSENSKIPRNFKEKEELRELIRKGNC